MICNLLISLLDSVKGSISWRILFMKVLESVDIGQNAKYIKARVISDWYI